MTTNKIWFVTGAGRGMGVDIAKAALAAGHKVVATGRNTDKVAKALGKSADLLVVKLDITKPADAQSAVKATVDRFGRIDVLVNNAANFYGGFFEELSPEQMERQLSTSLVGPMNVTRAVLSIMRKQRSGLVITISSTAGLIGFEFGTAYAASKFGCSRCRLRSNRLVSIRPLLIRASFALSFSRKNLQISQSGPSRTTTSAERNKWNFGKATTVSSRAIRPS
jgi:NAD(P)-dependent dehydrogenase (short-subunit alcohol dehydrogenase family)